MAKPTVTNEKMETPRKLQFADLEPVGPGTPVGRYLRLFWQPLMRAKDLPAATQSRSRCWARSSPSIAAKGGEPHVVEYRCAHRACPLFLGWVEGDAIRCRYHGWKFDASGQCIEQPAEERSFAHRIKMRVYPTKEYAGLIFAYLGEGEPPPFRHYPDLDRPGVIITDPVESAAVQPVEPAGQRPQPHPVGASRDRDPQGPARSARASARGRGGNALRLDGHALGAG